MIYTVHVPRDVYDPVVAADRARFIRDGFSWGAFLLGPVWLAWHRSWIGLFLDLVLIALAVLVQRLAGLPATGLPALLLALAVFIGFEGPSLVRASADRRRYRCVDVISAAWREEAEHRFLQRRHLRPAASQSRPTPTPGGDALGLFADEAG
jgi:hypothetical protein